MAEEATFSASQARTVSLLPIFPSICSIIGSGLVIRAIGKRKGRNGPYERLLLGMSISDCFYTFVVVWSPYLTPSNRWWPGNQFGNANTCRVIGTLLQASSSNMIYYGMLSFYFLMTVRFQMPQGKFEQLIEPWMHAFAVIWPVGTGIVGGALDLYDELELFPGCWVDNYPKGCKDDCKSPLIAWIYFGIIMVIIMICLIVNNFAIVLYVSRQYGLRSPTLGDSNFLATTPTAAQNRQLSGILQQTGQAKRVRMVVSQATLYVATFFLTWSWFNLLQVVESMDYGSRSNFPVFSFMVLQAFFTPLSGFWNAIIFFRPKYISMRRHRRSMQTSRWHTLLLVLGFGTRQTVGSRSEESNERSLLHLTILRTGNIGSEQTVAKIQRIVRRISSRLLSSAASNDCEELDRDVAPDCPNDSKEVPVPSPTSQDCRESQSKNEADEIGLISNQSDNLCSDDFSIQSAPLKM